MLPSVGGFDLLAGDAEQEEDGVEVRHADGGVGGLPHDRLGVEGDAEPGAGEHVEVVGAVADGHGLGEGHAGGDGERSRASALPAPVDDRADEPAGEAAVDDLERVGRGVVEAEVGGQGVGDLGEAAGDDGDLVVEPLEGADQGAGARGEDGRPAGPRRRPRRAGRRAGPPGCGATASKSSSPLMAASVTRATSAPCAGLLGQQLDDLALDEGRVDVHHHQPLGPPVEAGGLDGDVESCRRRPRPPAPGGAVGVVGARHGRARGW